MPSTSTAACARWSCARARGVGASARITPGPPEMAKAKRSASKDHLAIASAVRARRRRLGLTLQELADKSGLSAPFLSQVERSQTTPSITSLIAIAQALQVDIHYFINPPPSSQIVRRAKSPEVIDTGSPVKYVRL